jgi:hypothetical protein
MNEHGPISAFCTNCKKQTHHAFEGRSGALYRFACSICGRAKLLTVAEVRA